MRHGSLFSGIGGFDLAAEWEGWENLFHCEWNPFGQTVLKYYWPKAISYEDITKTDFTIHRGKIDILTGGFPCQPYSTAGKRKGKEDDRHLWPEMLRAIQEIKPTWIVGENVRGLVNWNGGMVFDEVQADLEAEGYEVQPFLLPACATGAEHRRDRIWFVSRLISNSGHNGLYSNKKSQKGSHGERSGFPLDESSSFQFGRITSNTYSSRQSRSRRTEGQVYTAEGGNWKKYRAFYDGRWPTVSPIFSRNDGFSDRLDFTSISEKEWLEESLKGAGNAIVPQVAHQIFKAITNYEKRQGNGGG